MNETTFLTPSVPRPPSEKADPRFAAGSFPSEVLMRLDANLRILSVNTEVETVTGHRADALAGEPISAWISEVETQMKWRHSLEKVLQSSEAVFLENSYPNLDRFFETWFSREIAPEKEPVIFALTREVTSENALTGFSPPRPAPPQRTPLLHSEAQSVSSLLVDLSHELRTPLNGILSTGELLLRSPLEEEQQRKVRLMQQSARSLLMMAENVLDLAQMDRGKIQLSQARLTLSDLAGEVVQLLKPAADEKGLEMRFQLSDDLPTDVFGDSERIRQILTNLLDNAIKYTPSGWVMLRVELARLTDAQAVVNFSISDTGIGIAPSRLASMFERFEQNPVAQIASRRGAGLGLAISRELAQRMQGSLTVSSVPGYGSEFRMALPLPRTTASVSSVLPKAEKPSPFPQSLRAPTGLAVVLDDDPVSRAALQDTLARIGWECLAAESWEAAKKSLRNETPSVFFLDYRLGERTALETAQIIREDSPDLAEVPLIIVSAHRQSEIKAMGGFRGVLSVLEKPVSPQTLRTALETLSKTPLPADNLSALNTVALLEKVAGNRSVLQQLALIFLQEYPPVLRAMEEARREGDQKAQFHAAHKLRGMTMGVSAETATQKLREFEEVLTAGTEPQIEQKLTVVREELKRLEAVLEQITVSETGLLSPV